MQIIDICVTVALFIVGCLIGNYFTHIYNTILSFNGPAFVIIAVGELIWWMIRKMIMNNMEQLDKGLKDR